MLVIKYYRTYDYGFNHILLSFKKRINDIFGSSEFQIDFCYRMRIGVK
jgi:hypothetical protein